jgi:hypothetical protein
VPDGQALEVALIITNAVQTVALAYIAARWPSKSDRRNWPR